MFQLILPAAALAATLIPPTDDAPVSGALPKTAVVASVQETSFLAVNNGEHPAFLRVGTYAGGATTTSVIAPHGTFWARIPRGLAGQAWVEFVAMSDGRLLSSGPLRVGPMVEADAVWLVSGDAALAGWAERDGCFHWMPPAPGGSATRLTGSGASSPGNDPTAAGGVGFAPPALGADDGSGSNNPPPRPVPPSGGDDPVI